MQCFKIKTSRGILVCYFPILVDGLEMQMPLAGIGNLRETESYYYLHKKQVSSFPFLFYPSQSNIQITDSSIITPDRKIFSNTQNVEKNIMNNPIEQSL